MGVKPLYYAALSCGSLFTSEIKALVREKRLRRDIDAEALRSYLSYLRTTSFRCSVWSFGADCLSIEWR